MACKSASRNRTVLASTIVALAMMLSLAIAASAKATVVTYCGYAVGPSTYCPSNTLAVPRHTYLSNRGIWGTTHHPGCDIVTELEEWIAYESSNGPVKYTAEGCNEAFIYHPNNTELLRPALWHRAQSSPTMYGYAAY